jgi:hypothetical protein
MPHKKQNNNKNTKRKIGRKLKRNHTYKKLKKGGFWPFKNKDASGNVVEEPKSSNFFGNLFKFTKSDPAEAIAKLKTEKEKCITDIDAKIAKIESTESTESTEPTEVKSPMIEEKKEQETLSTESMKPIEQSTLSMQQPQQQLQPQPQQQMQQPPPIIRQGGIVKKSKKRRHNNYAY